jgi:hypothetical protein
MARLTHDQLVRLRRHIQAGEALQHIFREGGFSNFLNAEIDVNEVATLVIYTSAHPDAVARLLDINQVARTTVDFHEDEHRWRVTWAVTYGPGAHEIAVICAHDKRPSQAAMYAAMQEMAVAA